MTLKEELKQVNEQIQHLFQRRDILMQLIVEDDEVSFEEKFNAWYSLGGHKTASDLFQLKSKCPLMRAELENCWIERHETVDFFDHFETLYLLANPEEGEVEEKEKWLAIAKEIMEANFRSVCFDW
jgi:hypothetical protein